jgi:hypothetical protein
VGESFVERDLKGSRFSWVDLTAADFERVYLRDARFASVDFTGSRIRDAVISDVAIEGEVESLTINGVDVVPLVEAELDRRHPERLKLRPTDADGFRAAWPVIEQLWDETVERARALEPSCLHEQVNGEWSFIETLRHLVFATDSWIGRAMLGDTSPWHPLSLPWDQMPDTEGVPRDRDARPSLEEMVVLRSERMATVARVLRDVTDEQLDGATTPVEGPGWPPARSFPVREVLMVILNEEWWHRKFAERDLAALAAR